MTKPVEMIQAALRKAAPQASDADIGRVAESIRVRGMLVGISDRLRLGRGPADGMTDLDALSRALGETFRVLSRCRADAARALHQQGIPLVTLAKTINEMNEQVKAAHAMLSSDDRPLLKGRPASRLGPSVAVSCAKAFEALTGRRATIATSATKHAHPASGPFLVLVTEVFEALQIDASAENCARSAAKARRAKEKKSRNSGVSLL